MATKTAAQRLEEAEDALHLLLTGTQEVQVQYDQTLVRYTQADIAELRQYISQLKGEVDPINSRRRPFGVSW